MPQTKQPKTIKTYMHGKKLVMTFPEYKVFVQDKAYYEGQGYPTEIAEQYAWDHFHMTRRKKHYA